MVLFLHLLLFILVLVHYDFSSEFSLTYVVSFLHLCLQLSVRRYCMSPHDGVYTGVLFGESLCVIGRCVY